MAHCLIFFSSRGAPGRVASCHPACSRWPRSRIDWSKSVLFPLDPQARREVSQTPLLWVKEFKYLGIVASRDLRDFLRLNMQPIVMRLKEQCNRWRELPLNLLGHINVLKMLFLPRFNYVFRNCPIWLPSSFFKELDVCIGYFIWKGSSLRLARSPFNYRSAVGGWRSPTS